MFTAMAPPMEVDKPAKVESRRACFSSGLKENMAPRVMNLDLRCTFNHHF